MATTANGNSIWRTVTCPKCSAEVGHMCFRLRFGTSFYERANYHAARKRRYAEIMSQNEVHSTKEK